MLRLNKLATKVTVARLNQGGNTPLKQEAGTTELQCLSSDVLGIQSGKLLNKPQQSYYIPRNRHPWRHE
jgi:hypothetical protein